MRPRRHQEVGGNGLCSYPHPWLMPDFWQFPTGSMGLGPLNAIYQARFMRYLEHRGLASTRQRYVWGVFGDGEMDEPESIAALTLAAREKLDNLTFIINCQTLGANDGAYKREAFLRDPQAIAPYLEAPFVALGTDGFGRSDTRASLRRYFEVDRHHIVVAALSALAAAASVAPLLVAQAIDRYGLDAEAPPPWMT